MSLTSAIAMAAEMQPIDVTKDQKAQAHDFVIKRLEQILIDEKLPREVIRSVLNERNDNPRVSLQTARDLARVHQTEAFAAVMASYSRPTKIVSGKEVSSEWEVEESLLKQDEERDLWEAYKGVREAMAAKGSTVEAFVSASAALEAPLERFFDSVFVMDEDEVVRRNRLAMMRDIASLPRGLIDLKSLPNF